MLLYLSPTMAHAMEEPNPVPALILVVVNAILEVFFLCVRSYLPRSATPAHDVLAVCRVHPRASRDHGRQGEEGELEESRSFPRQGMLTSDALP